MVEWERAVIRLRVPTSQHWRVLTLWLFSHMHPKCVKCFFEYSCILDKSLTCAAQATVVVKPYWSVCTSHCRATNSICKRNKVKEHLRKPSRKRSFEHSIAPGWLLSTLVTLALLPTALLVVRAVASWERRTPAVVKSLKKKIQNGLENGRWHPWVSG